MPASLYSAAEESQAIWVYLEQDQGRLAGVSLEMLARGREMADESGWQLGGLLLGHQIGELAREAIGCGADAVYLADHHLLENFTIEAYAHIATQAILAGKPSLLLLGATPDSRDLAGRLAVRLRTGLNADCTALRLDSTRGVLVCEISGFGGGVLALIEMQRHRPQMATVRPGVFAMGTPDPARRGEVIPLPVDISPGMIHTRVLERVRGETLDLTQAEALVVGGRGMGGDFATLRRLADILQGEVGATRPPVDEGHIERERQIGQTGVICSPKLVLCCGLSGAFHLVVGIEKADLVIAINSDPEAPIFEYCDYGVVGDVGAVLPALIAALQGEPEAAHA